MFENAAKLLGNLQREKEIIEVRYHPETEAQGGISLSEFS
jgi:hypothetical protein